MSGQLSRQAFSSCSRRLSSETKFVEKCPLPAFDSGCTYCQPVYPESLSVNPDATLEGTVPMLCRQVLVCSSKSDWPSRVENDPTSFAAKVREIQLSGVGRDKDFNFMITSTSLPSTNSKDHSVLLYPDGLYFPAIPDTQIEDFVKNYLVPSRANEVPNIESILNVQDLVSPTIIICGHTTRDARCGIAGPMIFAEFELVLRSKNLLYDKVKSPTGVRVSLASHVGGHAYAGNVIYLDKGQSVWYGHVRPEHVQGIVDQTVEKGIIIKELYRGDAFK
ncbi:Sucrase/ferredoxin-like-domain-containing protein [Lipomyces arxii]|uniref:Sucrase/ferredoxin-like-domain-containing protein n=1 Tax=Lipomyces arxii TaxID=56418 RepID=UPI0034CD9458